MHVWGEQRAVGLPLVMPRNDLFRHVKRYHYPFFHPSSIRIHGTAPVMSGPIAIDPRENLKTMFGSIRCAREHLGLVVGAADLTLERQV